MSTPDTQDKTQTPEKVSSGEPVVSKAEKKASGEAETGKDNYYENMARQGRALMKAREDGLRTGTHQDFGTPTIAGDDGKTIIKGGTPSKATLTETELKERMKGQDNGNEPPVLLAQNSSDSSPVNYGQDAASRQAENKAWLERREKRQENYQNDIAQQIKDEMYTPRDGQVWKLNDFQNYAFSPITDSYELSKHLEDGQPGKSKTLEETMDRLKSIPWADQISIRVDASGKFSDYSNADSMINLNPNYSQGKQNEEFVHEGYHATHQFLNKLYGGDKVDKQTYVNTYIWGEVGSMQQELKVREELGLKEPVTFKYIRPDGKEEVMDIGELVNKQGAKGLFDFLYSAQPANKGEKVYSQHYAENYERYKATFDQDKKLAAPYIQSWIKSGHRSDDI